MTGDKPFVVITGAGGGIGGAMVKTFHASGYMVIATDKDPPEIKLPFEQFIQADVQKTVMDPQYARDVFDRIRAYLPKRQLNALVNNAAVQILGSCESLSRADWRNTLDINLLAPFFWIQSLLGELEAANGSVVNVSSVHAHQTKKNFVAYATSKAALSALTRNMAVDLGKKIRVNAIEPAAVRTGMLIQGFEGSEQGLGELEAFHPIGRIAEPAEIAKIAVFLCSDDASFLQGSVVSATGGIHGCLSDPG